MSPKNLTVLSQCGGAKTVFPVYEIPFDSKQDIVTDLPKVFCGFQWKGGSLDYYVMYNPQAFTCAEPCVWFLRPEPEELCLQKRGADWCFNVYNH